MHVVASTGQGPEELLGGYFLTPQTNPPTPWPAEKFADLFTREVTEGMVVPRVERRGAAGLVATAATAGGMTATDESLFRGAARAALATGVPVSFRVGADAVADLEVVLDEGLPADRSSSATDRRRGDAGPAKVADRGAYVVLDHVGRTRPRPTDRAALVPSCAPVTPTGSCSRPRGGAALGRSATTLPHGGVRPARHGAAATTSRDTRSSSPTRATCSP